MKKNVANGLFLALIAGFSIWLYTYDEAAKPGPLSSAHEFIADCETCHNPWQGVTDEICLQCHFFPEVAAFKPELRFHEAHENCLGCHTEHLGRAAEISRVDHTLFHPDLSCAGCHFDVHQGRFGEDCRACHNISSWEIKGVSHPPADEGNCNLCHRPPASHREPEFWSRILEGHQMVTDLDDPPSVEECRRCHTTHRWGHLIMDHDL